MNFELKLGLHSSEKNHCEMTWGTLKVDKEVHFEWPLEAFTFALELFPNTSDNTAFHRGMHTNEHLLAYSKETGSVRASIEEVDPSFNGKWILDVSPYRFSNGNYGFRVTSLRDISDEVLQKTFALSIKKAIAYTQEMLEGRGDTQGFLGVPFAQAAQCGQYNFHSSEAAQKSLKHIPQDISITRNHIQDSISKLLVCDLRMLKPKLENRDDMVMFDPWVSYTLSEIMEQKLPGILGRNAVIVGTFGCMTGMYLCVSAHSW
jgi:S-ribosylhomocysteine lyase LuxS involved in autoinducer biosynthesis